MSRGHVQEQKVGVTLLDAHKIQTFPFHRLMQEFSLYRLAPRLLVTKESMIHFLHACFYDSAVQMPSSLNWLLIIIEPHQGGWWQEPWIENRGSYSMVLQVLCLTAGLHLHNLAPGGLSLWSPPAIHPFSFLWLSLCHMSPHAPSFPVHEHTLPRFDLSACVPSSSFLSIVWLTPTHVSSPKSYLLFQEGFPDYPSHPYSCRTVYAPLSQHLGY